MMLFGMTPHQPQVFLVLHHASTNGSGVNFVAYCFSEKRVFQNLEVTQEMEMPMEHLFSAAGPNFG